jgi:hypothetical protein
VVIVVIVVMVMMVVKLSPRGLFSLPKGCPLSRHIAGVAKRLDAVPPAARPRPSPLPLTGEAQLGVLASLGLFHGVASAR